MSEKSNLVKNAVARQDAMEFGKAASNARLDDELDADLKEVLGDFRSCVHGWSEAAYSRPRGMMAAAPPKRVWRLAAGWALGCLLLAGAASGGMYERHHQAALAQIAAVKALQAAEQQRKMAALQAQEEEELLAKVDSDVSREIPSAMEPLAQMASVGEMQEETK